MPTGAWRPSIQRRSDGRTKECFVTPLYVIKRAVGARCIGSPGRTVELVKRSVRITVAVGVASAAVVFGLVLSAGGASSQWLTRQIVREDCSNANPAQREAAIFADAPLVVSVEGNAGIAFYATPTQIAACMQDHNLTNSFGSLLRYFQGSVRVTFVATSAGHGLWAVVRTAPPVVSIKVVGSTGADRVQPLRDGYYLVWSPRSFTSLWHSGDTVSRMKLGVVVGFRRDGLVAGADSLFACRDTGLAVPDDC
jgi:hypothetical protein